jgi:hypothetical protein
LGLREGQSSSRAAQAQREGTKELTSRRSPRCDHCWWLRIHRRRQSSRPRSTHGTRLAERRRWDSACPRQATRRRRYLPCAREIQTPEEEASVRTPHKATRRPGGCPGESEGHSRQNGRSADIHHSTTACRFLNKLNRCRSYPAVGTCVSHQAQA